jgi:hypothetical protein
LSQRYIKDASPRTLRDRANASLPGTTPAKTKKGRAIVSHVIKNVQEKISNLKKILSRSSFFAAGMNKRNVAINKNNFVATIAHNAGLAKGSRMYEKGKTQ